LHREREWCGALRSGGEILVEFWSVHPKVSFQKGKGRGGTLFTGPEFGSKSDVGKKLETSGPRWGKLWERRSRPNFQAARKQDSIPKGNQKCVGSKTSLGRLGTWLHAKRKEGLAPTKLGAALLTACRPPGKGKTERRGGGERGNHLLLSDNRGDPKAKGYHSLCGKAQGKKALDSVSTRKKVLSSLALAAH